MATARKKQDEKHLKILRELVSLPANKQCFDCHQRGPTYINMTIGSFVCTSCSGLLRGLTPPHRVKSISMASFSPEEIELVKSRGNEYCRRIWLGLFDANHPQDTKDEQQIKDFMISKYEKKRYYLEPQASVKNGPVSFSPPETRSHSRTSTPTPVATIQDTKPLATASAPQSKPLTLGVKTSGTPADNMFTPDKSPSEFLADFGSADPFSSSMQFAPNATQPSFANFENNPIFNASTNHMFGNVMSRDNVPPRYNTNRWSMPTAATLSTLCNSVAFPSPARKASSSMGVGGYQQPLLSNPAASGQPPPEDRYAALKDLDSLMKTQQQQQQHHHQQQQQQQQHQHQQQQQQQQQQVPEPQVTEWTTVPAATGSWPVSSSSSVVSGSVFGSPSQSAFLSSGSSFAESGSAANPFTGNNVNPWVPVSSSNGLPSNSNPSVTFSANPFRTNRPAQANFGVSDGGFGWGTLGMNGLPNGQIVNGGLPPNAVGAFPTSQSMNFPAKTWQASAVGNPFVLGASPAPTGHSSNPFL